MTNDGTQAVGINGQVSLKSMRFEALDSWRGICALLVAMFHFPLAGAISQHDLVRGAFLFVDFFFVLSGFVFAHAYGARLSKGQGLRSFLFNRIGRLMPLHLFMLLVLVTLELVRWKFQDLGNGHAVFTGRNTLDAILPNLFMIHGLGTMDQLTWNTPSWSISTELYAYALFGCLFVLFKHKIQFVTALVIVACGLVFYKQSLTSIDMTYDYGLFRCLYGFASGIFVQRIFAALHVRSVGTSLPISLITVIELLTVALVVQFVSTNNSDLFSFFAPVVFGTAVLVFAREGGLISKLLKLRPLVYIGTISYSIYLTHLTVQGTLYALARYAHNHFNWADLVKLEIVGSQDFVYTPFENLILVSIMLGLTIALSNVTYRFVEKPSRQWFRNRADQSKLQSIIPAKGIHTA
jgi:peptidoglycan/LPS O-acetylase OafA/YrhL